MRSSSGLTLVELIIVMAILGVLLSFGVVSGRKMLQGREVRAAVNSFSQSIWQGATAAASRGEETVLVYSGDELSVTDGGGNEIRAFELPSNYQVLPHDSGNNSSFVEANNVDIIAPVSSSMAASLGGGQALMVNANGDAVMFTLNTVQQSGGPNSFTYRLIHPGCANTIDFTPNTLLFAVRTLGYSFDQADGTLSLREGGGAPVPLAFDLADFQVEYVYVKPDGTPVSLDTPVVEDGVPARNGTLAEGIPISLSRLLVQLRTERSGQAFSAVVELLDAETVKIEKVLSCG